MAYKYRLGIDAGGTFTDFVISELDGETRLFKAPSTPHDGTIAIRDGLGQIAEALGKSAHEIVQQADLCVNGTTVALNALITKNGVKTGLLCTTGHEDSLEIRLGHKEEGYRYDTTYPQAEMLVERHLRRPIDGRILSDGSEHAPLDEAAVRTACEYFKEQDVKSVAISFMWAAVNADHEKRAKAIVEEMLPGVPVCCGHEVYPQVREYTRTSTTVVNAYLTPVMDSYVARIDDLFRDLGASRPVRYFQSNGGLALGESMRKRAVAAINSGPASAPQAALFVAEPFGIDNCITVDMGGTSFDITLTRDGQTNVSKDIDFLRYRIGLPMIQVETLGAGGGSIAHLNAQGLLEVGPQSAGASPGPACYGKGGTLPTVTDANLVLGYLDPASVLGGTIHLDLARAREAIRVHLAEPLGITVERAAYGIFQIVNLNMVNGIRRVSTERGYDPRDFALVCAGGAAAMHITALAEDMGITEVLVPKLASGLCAFGQVISDVKYNQMSTHLALVNEGMDLGALNAAFARLEDQGRDMLARDGFSADSIRFVRSAEMRYVGQIHECAVPVPDGPLGAGDIATLIDAFHARHEQLFTYCERQNPVELVNIESISVGPVQKIKRTRLLDGNGELDAARKGERVAIVDDNMAATLLPVLSGEQFPVGTALIGPALIEEPTTTIVVRPGWSIRLDASGCYRLQRKD
jgi:N-methylhydantoinase A